MTAAIDRAAPRDIFDINLMPKRILQDKNFRSAVILLASSSRKDIRQLQLFNWDNSFKQKFEQRLFPVIRSNTQFNAKEQVNTALKMIAFFLEFSPQEKEYLDRLIDH